MNEKGLKMRYVVECQYCKYNNSKYDYCSRKANGIYPYNNLETIPTDYCSWGILDKVVE